MICERESRGRRLRFLEALMMLGWAGRLESAWFEEVLGLGIVFTLPFP
jgi:hypothetical protein